MTVSSSTTNTSTLNTTGLATFTGGLTVSSSTTNTSTLNTSGLATFTGGLYVSTGATNTQTITAAGLGTFNGGLTVAAGGLSVASGGLNVSSGNTNIQALNTTGLTVTTNESTFSNNVNFPSTKGIYLGLAGTTNDVSVMATNNTSLVGVSQKYNKTHMLCTTANHLVLGVDRTGNAQADTNFVKNGYRQNPQHGMIVGKTGSMYAPTGDTGQTTNLDQIGVTWRPNGGYWTIGTSPTTPTTTYKCVPSGAANPDERSCSTWEIQGGALQVAAYVP